MKLKIYTALLTVILLFTNTFHQILLSCGYMEDDGFGSDNGMSFVLSQRMLDDDALSPFFLVYNSYMATDVFMGVDSTGNTVFQKINNFDNTQENINEWKKYFKSASDEEISTVIYQLGKDGVKQLEMHLKLGLVLPTSISQKNKVVNQVIANKDFEWLEYMAYAYKCLEYVGGDYTSYDYYWSDNRDNRGLTYETCKALIDKAKLSMTKAKNKFIKQRYAFQICRLAHYFTVIYNEKPNDTPDLGFDVPVIDSVSPVVTVDNFVSKPNQYVNEYSVMAKIGIEIFEQSFKDTDKNMVEEWARAHYAPLLNFTGNNALAALQNARAFASCNSKRRATKTAMVYEMKQWEELKDGNLFQSLDDELNLRGLIALEKVETTVDDIIYIGERNPQHFMIPVLLMRELKKFENGFNSTGYETEYNEDGEMLSSERTLQIKEEHKMTTKAQAERLFDFCKSMNIKNVKAYDFLYQLTAGYLAYELDNYIEAYQIFNKACTFAPKQIQKDQVRMLILLNEVSFKPKINEAFESKLLKEFTWLDTCKTMANVAHNTKLSAISHLKEVYKGDETMLIFLDSWLTYPDYTSRPDLQKLEIIANYLKTESHTPLQKYFSAQIGITLDEIYEINGTVALSENEFEKAITWFNKVKVDSLIGKTYSDPFKTNISDCFECAEKATEVTSKLEYAIEMLALTKLEKSGKATFNTYLSLANAYYNTTHYGLNYNLLDYYRSSYVSYKNSDEDYNISYSDCNTAEQYYVKAALKSKQKEQKALCYFLAAKCAQNSDFASSNIQMYSKENYPDFKFTNRDKYFKIVSTQYHNTWIDKYAKEKCSYYFGYVN